VVSQAGLGAGAALAVVKATAAAVSQEHAWNARTLKWFGILLVLLLGAAWRVTTATFIWRTMATINRARTGSMEPTLPHHR
jgi:hypothetical protein